MRPTDPQSGEDQYRTVFEHHPDPSWVLDRATLRILAVNEAAIAELGYSRDEFLGKSYPDIAEDPMAASQELRSDASSRGSARLRLETKAGEPIVVEAVWLPVPFNRVPALLLTAEPMRRGLRRLLQEAEEGRLRLEALSRRLVEIQESERAEIARQIHDEIGQLLTGLKLILAVDGEVKGPDAGAPDAGELGSASERRSEMLRIVNELIGRLRDLSVNLRPPMLDEIGLIAALRWHFERYTNRTGVHVLARSELADIRFPAAVEIAAFRIVSSMKLVVVRTTSCREDSLASLSVNARNRQKLLRLEARATDQSSVNIRLIQNRFGVVGFDAAPILDHQSLRVVGSKMLCDRGADRSAKAFEG
jgi:PAS domain S-box-containing protein